MSNAPQQFIDNLKARLTERLGGNGYRVEAREPLDGELKATKEAKQIFITTEGMRVPDALADGGSATQIIMPVATACVMRRPGEEVLSAKVLRRRQTVMQAIQSVVEEFSDQRPDVLANIQNEDLLLIEGHHVSIITVDLSYDLDSEEDL
ncbi:hypothetical protein [Deinococcus sp. Marseille-Q6407]|uniref:hypothetical protein n=1 Tax=Deinococcus sp. Marseille-Q6407 TaxID=2969223 RepID=UPI0021BE19B3|nr:hypothetical protein [Deinococcus sp. Marseille-Q6407]